MKLRKLSVRHFRGIQECDWHIPTDLVCLVGPGDSTKTTLLDAIGLVLSRNYSVTLTDADFFDCDTTSPITITATITDLPDYLKREEEFGHWLSGLSATGELHSEPLPGSAPCLVIRLTVFADLEPVWEVIRVDVDETTRISARARQRIGFFRLGEFFETHLRWSRNSALSAMSERDVSRTTVVEAHRVARASVFKDPPQQLSDVAQKVARAAQTLGSPHFSSGLQPGIDPFTTSTGNSLVLHNQEIPLQGYGKGTQRLTSLAVQLHAAEGGAIVAIDEVEIGLEPHRLVHLIRSLGTALLETKGQVFLTTHSPVVIQTLTADSISVVRSKEGITTVTPIPTPIEVMQGTLRATPSALLSRKILVGEGSTEEGFLRNLVEHYDSDRSTNGQPNSGTLGVVVINGSGSTVVQRTLHLARLSYEVALLIDHDDPDIQKQVGDAVKAGVAVFQCSKDHCFEEDFVLSLTPAALDDFIDLILETVDAESTLSRVNSHLSLQLPSLNSSDWPSVELSYEDIRLAFAKAAAGRKQNGSKAKGWFKSYEGGKSLARFYIDNCEHFETSHLVGQIKAITNWIYDTDSGEGD